MITTKQKLRNLPKPDLDITLDGEQLSNVTKEKLLGVTVEQHLTWTNHIDKVCTKINRSLALLRRIKQFLPLNSRILFYNGFIFPHINYCLPVWCTSPNIDKIFKLQKRAARIILDENMSTQTRELFSKLNWITIEDLTKYRRAIIVFKALSGLAPDYISNMFKSVNKVHSRNTRAALSEKLCIPKTRTQTYNNTLRYSGARIWNDLTQPVRQSTSINHFKSNYFKFKST